MSAQLLKVIHQRQDRKVSAPGAVTLVSCSLEVAFLTQTAKAACHFQQNTLSPSILDSFIHLKALLVRLATELSKYLNCLFWYGKHCRETIESNDELNIIAQQKAPKPMEVHFVLSAGHW